MRAPRFWSEPPGALATALRPLGALYEATTARRLARPGARAGVPVICVGNLTAGGAGKTPTVMAVLERLAARGLAAHVLTRGYGGREGGPMQVDPARHDAADVGDEALLLSAFAPVWVARDRAAGASAAVAEGAAVLVMDDGMQNPSLGKDLTLLVVDAAYGFGNGLTIPAGPLRQPVAAGMARADLLIAIGPEAARAEFGRRWGAAVSVPSVAGELKPLQTGMPWQGLRCLAFAGIGRPEKFFGTLEGLGADVARRIPLGDHQPLDGRLMERMSREAAGLGARMVTTEKDAVRLPPAYRSQVLTLPVRLAFEDPAPLDAALDRLQPSAAESFSSNRSDISS